MEVNWPPILKRLLVIEGGNDDDPQDPGGRTSRGIIQREWNVFRQTHPGRPADVWKAPQADVESIYHDGQYWAGQLCPQIVSGPDDVVLDYGVNSGVGRSGRVLRHLCGLPTNTYKIDDSVIAAVKKRDPKAIIDAMCDERMAFLRSLHTFPRFGAGWTRRVREDRAFAKHLAAGGTPSTAPVPAPVKVPGKGQHSEPKVAKGAVQGGGAAGGGALALAAHWVGAHPIITAAIAVAAVAGIILVVRAISQWHHTRSVTPMPGTPVVPELVQVV